MAATINRVIGQPTQRFDAILKVTGAACYPSDEPVANPAYAYLLTSSIARGRVTGFDIDQAGRVHGFLEFLNFRNIGPFKSPPAPGGKGGTPTTLESDEIWHAGQIIGVVLADSFESAREAAHLIRVAYAEEAPAATFGAAGLETAPAKQLDKKHDDPVVGDGEAAYRDAEVKVESQYSTPTQHHNPMELFTTTCQWSGESLTIYEPSQFVHAVRAGVAQQLDIEPEKVRVISRYVGGGFGSRGGLTSRTALIAIAAKRLRRPVKLVATRAQGFTIATYRAETQHRLRLGAKASGELTALCHEGWELTSRPSLYNVAGTVTTSRMYACPNVWTKVNIARADRSTPGFMRAPPEVPYLFALESAMDELAVKTGIDPVELRIRNDTRTEPIKGLPFSSRGLVTCLKEAAARFGWKCRRPEPQAMRDGEWLVGWGCASAAYHASISASSARVKLYLNGTAKVETAAHDIGTGAYTVIAMTAADRLGISVDKIQVEIGDSNLPAAGLAAGSTHTASICTAVAKACEDIRSRLAAAASSDADSDLSAIDPGAIELSNASLQSGAHREDLSKAVARFGCVVEVYAENLPPGAPKNGMQMLYQGQPAMARGSELKDQIRYSFGAHFVEVRVHARTREVRVPRAVSAFAAGVIVNPITAKSQLMGGMIWGISSALHEATEIDRLRARYYNDDLAEYLVPVNADINEIDVIFVPEEDKDVNPLGIKGVGELGTTGMNAAVANAVYHATGKRIRDLPIRIEQLL